MPELIEPGDLVEFAMGAEGYAPRGIVDFTRTSRGKVWYFVDWEDGKETKAWYPVLTDEIRLISKGTPYSSESSEAQPMV